MCLTQDIICLQETLLTPHDRFGIKNFNIIRNDITTPGLRGVCLLIKNNITFNFINLDHLRHPSVELLGIALTLCGKTFILVNVYRHPNSTTPIKWYSDLFSLSNAYDFAMFAGDFNAHHTLWGCDSSDRVGKLLARAAEACDICMTNDDLPTLLLPPKAHISIIDLVAVSSSLAPITVTHTAEDTHGSDHFPVVTRIGGEIHVAHRFLYKLKLRPREVKELREILASPLPPFLTIFQ